VGIHAELLLPAAVLECVFAEMILLVLLMFSACAELQGGLPHGVAQIELSSFDDFLRPSKLLCGGTVGNTRNRSICTTRREGVHNSIQELDQGLLNWQSGWDSPAWGLVWGKCLATPDWWRSSSEAAREGVYCVNVTELTPVKQPVLSFLTSSFPTPPPPSTGSSSSLAPVG